MPSGKWVEEYPSDERARYRLFKRQKMRGPFSAIDLELRLILIEEPDRFFQAQRWQAQLDRAEVRSMRIEGYPRLTDGWLLVTKR